MKTTIDIPETLYKKAKIRAFEQGQSLKDLVVRSLHRELEPSSTGGGNGKSLWASRKLRPGYVAALKAGAFSGGTDSSIAISEERNAR